MKKLILLISCITIVSCAKKTETPPEESDSVTTEKIIVDDAEAKKTTKDTTYPTYYGQGTFSPDGKAKFNVALPANYHSQVKVSSVLRTSNNVVFVQIKTDDDIDLTNVGGNQMKLLEFDIPDPIVDVQKFTLFLWHDSTKVTTVVKATAIISNRCKNKGLSPNTPPEQCGNGVLSIDQ